MKTHNWQSYLPRYNGGRLLLFPSRAKMSAYLDRRFDAWPALKMIRQLTIEIAAATCACVLKDQFVPLRLISRGKILIMGCDSHCGVIRQILTKPDAQGLIRVKVDLYGPTFN